MNHYSIQEKNNQLEINLIQEQSKKLGRVFLQVMMSLFVGLTIAVVMVVFSMEEANYTPLMFGLFLLAATGWFYKMYLWNTHGKEVIVISESSLVRYFDYKRFKGTIEEYPLEKLQAHVVTNREKIVRNDEVLDELKLKEESDKGWLRVNMGDFTFVTQVDLEMTQLKEVVVKIDEYIKKTT